MIAVGREAARAHHRVDVGMEEQLPRPGVQHHRDGGQRAQTSWVARQRQERLRRGPEEHREERRAVVPDGGVAGQERQCEHGQELAQAHHAHHKGAFLDRAGLASDVINLPSQGNRLDLGAKLDWDHAKEITPIILMAGQEL